MSRIPPFLFWASRPSGHGIASEDLHNVERIFAEPHVGVRIVNLTAT
jgi:hypothetical protein